MYVPENGSEQITTIIQAAETYLYISELTCIEIKSSFVTKYRTRQISKEEWLTALQAFDKSLANFYIEPLNEFVRADAEQLIQTYAIHFALRALDAIQLATYRRLTYINVILVSSDERMNVLATELGHVI
ncbi:type II toxin-antitoxin system VapC family toxin [Spirosoma soli]|uniref:Type II toxin-antitoxin system VapC family toxin n=1 Tax=Spirosoma soli TaxID=1770529 RepID=A0ABW5M5N9_9BACT